MPRRRLTLGEQAPAAHPDDRLITWQEAAAKLCVHDKGTWARYVRAYPALARAARYRRIPGEAPERLWLASAVAAFCDAGFSSEAPDGEGRAANFGRGSRSKPTTPVSVPTPSEVATA